MKKIAIMIVFWNLSITVGAQRQSLELAKYISERGYEVKIYCAYFDLERCYPKIIKDLKAYSLYNKDFSVQRDPIPRFFYPLEILFFSKEFHSYVNLMNKVLISLILMISSHFLLVIFIRRETGDFIS